ncbi:MAG: Phosphatidate cytidylyltransferase [bacterium ADurb.Bin429]|nr:MAG: Phosphatidate cytidylyltransferase [bacterium ADurb.Bin429]
MLRDRLLAAVFGLPMLLVLLWLNYVLRGHNSPDDLPLLFVVLLIAGGGGWEISRVVRQRFPDTSRWNGVYAALILPFLVHAIRLAINPNGAGMVPVSSLGLLVDSLGATAAVMFLFLAVWSDAEHRGWTGIKENLIVIAGGLYLGGTLSAVLLLGETQFREMAVLFVFFGVFALDTAAYFGGRTFNGPKLAPRVSPSKTWAGAVCGLLAAMAIAVLFKLLPPLFGAGDAWWNLGARLSWTRMLLLGAAVGIFGQLGDLVESVFKRWGHVKDSGSFLPGHGGFLDRFDSLFLAAPVVYLLLAWFLGFPR